MPGGRKCIWRKFRRCLKQKKFFRSQNSKLMKFYYRFLGGGPKMAHLEFRGEMPKMAKITIFPKISPRQVSVSHKELRIDLWEV